MKSIMISLLGMLMILVATCCTTTAEPNDHIVRSDTITIAERGVDSSTLTKIFRADAVFDKALVSILEEEDSIAEMLSDTLLPSTWFPLESPKDTFIEMTHNVWYNDATWDIIDSTYYYDDLRWEIDRTQAYVDWLKTQMR